jgi:hypothetical protein
MKDEDMKKMITAGFQWAFHYYKYRVFHDFRA